MQGGTQFNDVTDCGYANYKNPVSDLELTSAFPSVMSFVQDDGNSQPDPADPSYGYDDAVADNGFVSGVTDCSELADYVTLINAFNHIQNNLGGSGICKGTTQGSECTSPVAEPDSQSQVIFDYIRDTYGGSLLHERAITKCINTTVLGGECLVDGTDVVVQELFDAIRDYKNDEVVGEGCCIYRDGMGQSACVWFDDNEQGSKQLCEKPYYFGSKASYDSTNIADFFYEMTKNGYAFISFDRDTLSEANCKAGGGSFPLVAPAVYEVADCSPTGTAQRTITFNVRDADTLQPVSSYIIKINGAPQTPNGGQLTLADGTYALTIEHEDYATYSDASFTVSATEPSDPVLHTYTADMDPQASVSGTVAFSGFDPVTMSKQFVTVKAMQGSQVISSDIVDPSDNTYELFVDAGTYDIIIEPNVFFSYTNGNVNGLAVSGDVSGIDFTLTAKTLYNITFQVYFDEHTIIEPIEIYGVTGDDSTCDLASIGTDPDFNFDNLLKVTGVSQPGTDYVLKVPAGEYCLFTRTDPAANDVYRQQLVSIPSSPSCPTTANNTYEQGPGDLATFTVSSHINLPDNCGFPIRLTLAEYDFTVTVLKGLSIATAVSPAGDGDVGLYDGEGNLLASYQDAQPYSFTYTPVGQYYLVADDFSDTAGTTYWPDIYEGVNHLTNGYDYTLTMRLVDKKNQQVAVFLLDAVEVRNALSLAEGTPLTTTHLTTFFNDEKDNPDHPGFIDTSETAFVKLLSQVQTQDDLYRNDHRECQQADFANVGSNALRGYSGVSSELPTCLLTVEVNTRTDAGLTHLLRNFSAGARGYGTITNLTVDVIQGADTQVILAALDTSVIGKCADAPPVDLSLGGEVRPVRHKSSLYVRWSPKYDDECGVDRFIIHVYDDAGRHVFQTGPIDGDETEHTITDSSVNGYPFQWDTNYYVCVQAFYGSGGGSSSCAFAESDLDTNNNPPTCTALCDAAGYGKNCQFGESTKTQIGKSTQTQDQNLVSSPQFYCVNTGNEICGDSWIASGNDFCASDLAYVSSISSQAKSKLSLLDYPFIQGDPLYSYADQDSYQVSGTSPYDYVPDASPDKIFSRYVRYYCDKFNRIVLQDKPEQTQIYDGDCRRFQHQLEEQVGPLPVEFSCGHDGATGDTICIAEQECTRILPTIFNIADPFGSFAYENACNYVLDENNNYAKTVYSYDEGTVWLKNYCYLDKSVPTFPKIEQLMSRVDSYTSIDECTSCKTGGSCSDYLTQSACGVDNCGYRNCTWVGDDNGDPSWDTTHVFSSLGYGVCVSVAQESQCERCFDSDNPLLNTCTKNKCDLLGPDCYWDNDTLTRSSYINSPLDKDGDSSLDYDDSYETQGNTKDGGAFDYNCVNCEYLSCYDIDNQADCDSGAGTFSFLDNTVLSNTPACSNLPYCSWVSGRCVKNNNLEGTDDCASFSSNALRACQTDMRSPITTLKIDTQGKQFIGFDTKFSFEVYESEADSVQVYYCIDTTDTCDPNDQGSNTLASGDAFTFASDDDGITQGSNNCNRYDCGTYTQCYADSTQTFISPGMPYAPQRCSDLCTLTSDNACPATDNNPMPSYGKVEPAALVRQPNPSLFSIDTYLANSTLAGGSGSGPLDIARATREGRNYLRYFAVDRYGNYEPLRSYEFHVDTTDPIIDFTYESAPYPVESVCMDYPDCSVIDTALSGKGFLNITVKTYEPGVDCTVLTLTKIDDPEISASVAFQSQYDAFAAAQASGSKAVLTEYQYAGADKKLSGGNYEVQYACRDENGNVASGVFSPVYLDSNSDINAETLVDVLGAKTSVVFDPISGELAERHIINFDGAYLTFTTVLESSCTIYEGTSTAGTVIATQSDDLDASPTNYKFRLRHNKAGQSNSLDFGYEDTRFEYFVSCDVTDSGASRTKLLPLHVYFYYDETEPDIDLYIDEQQHTDDTRWYANAFDPLRSRFVEFAFAVQEQPANNAGIAKVWCTADPAIGVCDPTINLFSKPVEPFYPVKSRNPPPPDYGELLFGTSTICYNALDHAGNQLAANQCSTVRIDTTKPALLLDYENLTQDSSVDFTAYVIDFDQYERFGGGPSIMKRTIDAVSLELTNGLTSPTSSSTYTTRFQNKNFTELRIGADFEMDDASPFEDKLDLLFNYVDANHFNYVRLSNRVVAGTEVPYLAVYRRNIGTDTELARYNLSAVVKEGFFFVSAHNEGSGNVIEIFLYDQQHFDPSDNPGGVLASPVVHEKIPYPYQLVLGEVGVRSVSADLRVKDFGYIDVVAQLADNKLWYGFNTLDQQTAFIEPVRYNFSLAGQTLSAGINNISLLAYDRMRLYMDTSPCPLCFAHAKDGSAALLKDDPGSGPGIVLDEQAPVIFYKDVPGGEHSVQIGEGTGSAHWLDEQANRWYVQFGKDDLHLTLAVEDLPDARHSAGIANVTALIFPKGAFALQGTAAQRMLLDEPFMLIPRTAGQIRSWYAQQGGSLLGRATYNVTFNTSALPVGNYTVYLQAMDEFDHSSDLTFDVEVINTFVPLVFAEVLNATIVDAEKRILHGTTYRVKLTPEEGVDLASASGFGYRIKDSIDTYHFYRPNQSGASFGFVSDSAGRVDAGLDGNVTFDFVFDLSSFTNILEPVEFTVLVNDTTQPINIVGDVAELKAGDAYTLFTLGDFVPEMLIPSITSVRLVSNSSFTARGFARDEAGKRVFDRNVTLLDAAGASLRSGLVNASNVPASSSLSGIAIHDEHAIGDTTLCIDTLTDVAGRYLGIDAADESEIHLKKSSYAYYAVTGWELGTSQGASQSSVDCFSQHGGSLITIAPSLKRNAGSANTATLFVYEHLNGTFNLPLPALAAGLNTFQIQTINPYTKAGFAGQLRVYYNNVPPAIVSEYPLNGQVLRENRTEIYVETTIADHALLAIEDISVTFNRSGDATKRTVDLLSINDFLASQAKMTDQLTVRYVPVFGAQRFRIEVDYAAIFPSQRGELPEDDYEVTYVLRDTSGHQITHRQSFTIDADASGVPVLTILGDKGVRRDEWSVPWHTRHAAVNVSLDFDDTFYYNISGVTLVNTDTQVSAVVVPSSIYDVDASVTNRSYVLELSGLTDGTYELSYQASARSIARGSAGVWGPKTTIIHTLLADTAAPVLDSPGTFTYGENISLWLNASDESSVASPVSVIMAKKGGSPVYHPAQEYDLVFAGLLGSSHAYANLTQITLVFNDTTLRPYPVFYVGAQDSASTLFGNVTLTVTLCDLLDICDTTNLTFEVRDTTPPNATLVSHTPWEGSIYFQTGSSLVFMTDELATCDLIQSYEDLPVTALGINHSIFIDAFFTETQTPATLRCTDEHGNQKDKAYTLFADSTAPVIFATVDTRDSDHPVLFKNGRFEKKGGNNQFNLYVNSSGDLVTCSVTSSQPVSNQNTRSLFADAQSTLVGTRLSTQDCQPDGVCSVLDGQEAEMNITCRNLALMESNLTVRLLFNGTIDEQPPVISFINITDGVSNASTLTNDRTYVLSFAATDNAGLAADLTQIRYTVRDADGINRTILVSGVQPAGDAIYAVPFRLASVFYSDPSDRIEDTARFTLTVYDGSANNASTTFSRLIDTKGPQQFSFVDYDRYYTRVNKTYYVDSAAFVIAGWGTADSHLLKLAGYDDAQFITNSTLLSVCGSFDYLNVLSGTRGSKKITLYGIAGSCPIPFADKYLGLFTEGGAPVERRFGDLYRIQSYVVADDTVVLTLDEPLEEDAGTAHIARVYEKHGKDTYVNRSILLPSPYPAAHEFLPRTFDAYDNEGANASIAFSYDDSVLCTGPDQDGDGICDTQDNCPDQVNGPAYYGVPAAQFDQDDYDGDGDGFGDICDLCPATAASAYERANDIQFDSDSDGLGDACDVSGTCVGAQCGEVCTADSDSDGICDVWDNCPTVANPSQTPSTLISGVGVACEPQYFDADGDGQPDATDNCPLIYNPSQRDTDSDGTGDACDGNPTYCEQFRDTDGDSICDEDEISSCIGHSNAYEQAGVTRVNLTDSDGDGIPDWCDLCWNVPDTYPQNNADAASDAGDASLLFPRAAGGDACDLDCTGDGDHDGVCDLADNCPNVFNPSQNVSSLDPGKGDACDANGCIDTDADGVCDTDEEHLQPNSSCRLYLNVWVGGVLGSYRDADSDGMADECNDNCNVITCVGPACDPTQSRLFNPAGGYPPRQADSDGDGFGDSCDACTDADQDGFCENVAPEQPGGDNCPTVYNPSQHKTDPLQALGDACLAGCLGDDTDGDLICDRDEQLACPDVFSSQNISVDGRSYVRKGENSDTDARWDVCDNCWFAANPSQDNADAANDTQLSSSVYIDFSKFGGPFILDPRAGDACDLDCLGDADGDGVCDFDANNNTIDICPTKYNPSQNASQNPCTACGGHDADSDGICDIDDLCPVTANIWEQGVQGVWKDRDADGVPDECDNCLSAPNPFQQDDDGDGLGDVCDFSCSGLDVDRDFVCDADDNCPFMVNSDQQDSDGDGIGDVCEPECSADSSMFFATTNISFEEVVIGAALTNITLTFDNVLYVLQKDTDYRCSAGSCNVTFDFFGLADESVHRATLLARNLFGSTLEESYCIYVDTNLPPEPAFDVTGASVVGGMYCTQDFTSVSVSYPTNKTLAFAPAQEADLALNLTRAGPAEVTLSSAGQEADGIYTVAISSAIMQDGQAGGFVTHSAEIAVDHGVPAISQVVSSHEWTDGIKLVAQVIDACFAGNIKATVKKDGVTCLNEVSLERTGGHFTYALSRAAFNAAVPVSCQILNESDYFVTYTATDVLGNSNSSSFMLSLEDLTPPTITFLYPQFNDVQFANSDINVTTNEPASCTLTYNTTGEQQHAFTRYLDQNGISYHTAKLNPALIYPTTSLTVTCTDESRNPKTSVVTKLVGIDIQPPSYAVSLAGNIMIGQDLFILNGSDDLIISSNSENLLCRFHVESEGITSSYEDLYGALQPKDAYEKVSCFADRGAYKNRFVLPLRDVDAPDPCLDINTNETYTYSVICRDGAGNVGSVEKLTFTYDKDKKLHVFSLTPSAYTNKDRLNVTFRLLRNASCTTSFTMKPVQGNFLTFFKTLTSWIQLSSPVQEVENLYTIPINPQGQAQLAHGDKVTVNYITCEQRKGTLPGVGVDCDNGDVVCVDPVTVPSFDIEVDKVLRDITITNPVPFSSLTSSVITLSGITEANSVVSVFLYDESLDTFVLQSTKRLADDLVFSQGRFVINEDQAFSTEVFLTGTTNLIKVRVVDRAGNVQEKELTVFYNPTLGGFDPDGDGTIVSDPDNLDIQDGACSADVACTAASGCAGTQLCIAGQYSNRCIVDDPSCTYLETHNPAVDSISVSEGDILPSLYNLTATFIDYSQLQDLVATEIILTNKDTGAVTVVPSSAITVIGPGAITAALGLTQEGSYTIIVKPVMTDGASGVAGTPVNFRIEHRVPQILFDQSNGDRVKTQLQSVTGTIEGTFLVLASNETFMRVSVPPSVTVLPTDPNNDNRFSYLHDFGVLANASLVTTFTVNATDTRTFAKGARSLELVYDKKGPAITMVSPISGHTDQADPTVVIITDEPATCRMTTLTPTIAFEDMTFFQFMTSDGYYHVSHLAAGLSPAKDEMNIFIKCRDQNDATQESLGIFALYYTDLALSVNATLLHDEVLDTLSNSLTINASAPVKCEVFGDLTILPTASYTQDFVLDLSQNGTLQDNRSYAFAVVCRDRIGQVYHEVKSFVTDTTRPLEVLKVTPADNQRVAYGEVNISFMLNRGAICYVHNAGTPLTLQQIPSFTEQEFYKQVSGVDYYRLKGSGKTMTASITGLANSTGTSYTYHYVCQNSKVSGDVLQGSNRSFTFVYDTEPINISFAYAGNKAFYRAGALPITVYLTENITDPVVQVVQSGSLVESGVAAWNSLVLDGPHAGEYQYTYTYRVVKEDSTEFEAGEYRDGPASVRVLNGHDAAGNAPRYTDDTFLIETMRLVPFTHIYDGGTYKYPLETVTIKFENKATITSLKIAKSSDCTVLLSTDYANSSSLTTNAKGTYHEFYPPASVYTDDLSEKCLSLTFIDGRNLTESYNLSFSVRSDALSYVSTLNKIYLQKDQYPIWDIKSGAETTRNIFEPLLINTTPVINTPAPRLIVQQAFTDLVGNYSNVKLTVLLDDEPIYESSAYLDRYDLDLPEMFDGYHVLRLIAEDGSGLVYGDLQLTFIVDTKAPGLRLYSSVRKKLSDIVFIELLSRESRKVVLPSLLQSQGGN